MNDYEIVKVHLRGVQETSFTYRGENGVPLGLLFRCDFEISSPLVVHEKSGNERPLTKFFISLLSKQFSGIPLLFSWELFSSNGEVEIKYFCAPI